MQEKLDILRERRTQMERAVYASGEFDDIRITLHKKLRPD